MVAEVVPEKRRIEAGALLYTSAPFGLVLATLVNYAVAGRLFRASSRGLLALRLPERPDSGRRGAPGPLLREGAGALGSPSRIGRRRRLAELFTPAVPAGDHQRLLITAADRAHHCGGAATPSSRWSRAAWPSVEAPSAGLDRGATLALVESWKAHATNWFNLGGLIGTLLTVPAAKYLGRRPMFALYFAGSARGDPRDLRPRRCRPRRGS